MFWGSSDPFQGPIRFDRLSSVISMPSRALSEWWQVVAEVKAILGAYLPRGYLTPGAKDVVSNHRHVYPLHALSTLRTFRVAIDTMETPYTNME